MVCCCRVALARGWQPGTLGLARAARAPWREVFPDMFSLAMAHQAFEGDDLADQGLRARFEKNVQTFLSLAEAAKHYPCMKRAWVEFLGEPPSAGADRVDPRPS